jgi:hypothetical protein
MEDEDAIPKTSTTKGHSKDYSFGKNPRGCE